MKARSKHKETPNFFHLFSSDRLGACPSFHPPHPLSPWLRDCKGPFLERAMNIRIMVEWFTCVCRVKELGICNIFEKDFPSKATLSDRGGRCCITSFLSTSFFPSLSCKKTIYSNALTYLSFNYMLQCCCFY